MNHESEYRHWNYTRIRKNMGTFFCNFGTESLSNHDSLSRKENNRLTCMAKVPRAKSKAVDMLGKIFVTCAGDKGANTLNI